MPIKNLEQIREERATGKLPHPPVEIKPPMVDSARLGIKVKAVKWVNGGFIVASAGSVVNFAGNAIVNAANQGCLGGGGVDGAISSAGGRALYEARSKLPLVDGKGAVRCPTGEARLTIGGNLKANYCIHAVGPNYRM